MLRFGLSRSNQDIKKHLYKAIALEKKKPFFVKTEQIQTKCGKIQQKRLRIISSSGREPVSLTVYARHSQNGLLQETP